LSSEPAGADIPRDGERVGWKGGKRGGRVATSVGSEREGGAARSATRERDDGRDSGETTRKKRASRSANDVTAASIETHPPSFTF
jgi:hypothetical protein